MLLRIKINMDTVITIYAIIAIFSLMILLPARGQNPFVILIMAVFWPATGLLWLIGRVLPRG